VYTVRSMIVSRTMLLACSAILMPRVQFLVRTHGRHVPIMSPLAAFGASYWKIEDRQESLTIKPASTTTFANQENQHEGLGEDSRALLLSRRSDT
jgi:hypothetical protein